MAKPRKRPAKGSTAKKKPAKKKGAVKKPTDKKPTSTASPSSTSSSAPDPSTSTSSGAGTHGAGSILWGGVTGTQFDNGGQAPWDMNVVSDFTKADALGKHEGIVPMYSAFYDCSTTPCQGIQFPSAQFTNVRTYGAIPMVSWGSSSLQSGSFDGVTDKNFNLADVVSGKYDSYITSWARTAKAWGHPFFLRFDWEMNGDWFVWDGNTNGNSAAEYVAAWRHVHNIFMSVGATNATWVWCPNNGDQSGSTASMASYYPGNSYVDWTCMDAYNFGATDGGVWNSWDNIAQNPYNAVQAIAPSKPMMIGEFASGTTGGSQAAWLTQTLAEIPARYPNIHAILVYDASDPRWQLEGHPLSQAAFAAGIQNPAYSSASEANLNSSPIPAP